MRDWKCGFSMANESDTLGGASHEERPQPSDELALGLEPAPRVSQEGFAPPWLRMDPELSRTVLSKTEEELLGALSALMRHKIEHEKAQRALAHTILEIEQAKQDVAGVKRQVAAAEDELHTRLADHSRVVDEIAQARSQLEADQAKYLEFQHNLIALKNEIEEARKEKAELQLEHGNVRNEIEKLKAEVVALQEERSTATDRLESIRKELDDRLVARESLIQQITTMEGHLAELTSTRDIRENAQRIALVGRGTESMRDEIQQLKAEIDRIEKERVRLASERDRVESEFAGLENRLNSARFSYVETLERLDEARAALAVTEKEHDEAVSKLQRIHEHETKPLPVTENPAEEQYPEPKEAVAEKETPRPVQEPAVQELALEESAQERSLKDPAQETFALKEPTQERAVAKPMPEPVKELVSEPALPLLTDEPLPAVIPSWDSYRLESEFFTDETLDADRVADLVAGLPGIEHVLIVRQHGAVLSGNLPSRLADQLKTPGRDYERLFHSWPNRVPRKKNERTQTATFHAGDEFLTATQAEDIFLIASHEHPKLQPGVEDKLAVVAEELAKMYPELEQGIDGTGVSG
jgi:predicted  nucleic acid-binding Zn-ribbon protein